MQEERKELKMEKTFKKCPTFGAILGIVIILAGMSVGISGYVIGMIPYICLCVTVLPILVFGGVYIFYVSMINHRLYKDLIGRTDDFCVQHPRKARCVAFILMLIGAAATALIFIFLVLKITHWLALLCLPTVGIFVAGMAIWFRVIWLK